MFDIEYKGGNTVVVSTKKTTLVTDPRQSVIGLKDIKMAGCVELATETRFALYNNDAKLVIDQPGEYEVGDFVVRGESATRHIDSGSEERLSTLYRLECGNISLGIIGNVAPDVSDDQLEELGVIDILVVPVGGSGYTLDATNAVKLTRSIDPKIVIPVHYDDPGVTYEVPQEPVEVFLKELGAPVEHSSKLRIKNESSLPASLTVCVLVRS